MLVFGLDPIVAFCHVTSVISCPQIALASLLDADELRGSCHPAFFDTVDDVSRGGHLDGRRGGYWGVTFLRPRNAEFFRPTSRSRIEPDDRTSANALSASARRLVRRSNGCIARTALSSGQSFASAKLPAAGANSNLGTSCHERIGKARPASGKAYTVVV